MQEMWLKAMMAAQQGSHYCFVTIIEATIKGTPRKAGAKMLVFPEGSIHGTIGGGRNEKAAIAEALQAIKSGKPKTVTYNYFGREGESVCGGQMTVFIEPIKAESRLIICGAGHIALPLSCVATMLGFKTTVIDTRKAYANRKRFAHVEKVVVTADYEKSLASLSINPSTFIVIVTHGNEHDYVCLKSVVKSDAAYIGVISSKPKKVKFISRLKAAGIKQELINRVHIPTGIDIGAQTPQEIAVSIAAELIAVRNREHIGTDKFKVDKINRKG